MHNKIRIFIRLLVFGITFTLLLRLKVNAQNILHNIQLNGGLISQPSADIYLGKLDYVPQFKLSNDAFRFGINTGIYYVRKSIDVSAGINASFRIHRFSTLNKNFTLGGIYLRVGHEWASSSEKILTGALSFEFTQVALNVSYGRDLHFDNNWITYGFGFLFTKSETDEDE